jgi:hypothetical protein
MAVFCGTIPLLEQHGEPLAVRQRRDGYPLNLLGSARD